MTGKRGKALHEWAPHSPDTDRHVTKPEAAGPATTVSRRVALKVLATTAAVPLVACEVEAPPQPETNPLALGTATDPDLLRPVVPWPLQLSPPELDTVRALADLILPADGRSPSASQTGAHHYVNEHVSAPYEAHARDLVLVRGGLVWLDSESLRRHQRRFHELSAEEQRSICDQIRYLPDARPEHRAHARFFDKVRDLVATAFWTTEEGMADLGFVGNVARTDFPGPPSEVLSRLGLD